MFSYRQGNRIPQLPEPWQLSAIGISFIRECFTLDPMKRPTAEEMLNHPWMQSLRAELADVDTGEDGMYQMETQDNSLPAEAQPDIAHAAQLMEERQLEDILGSPREEELEETIR